MPQDRFFIPALFSSGQTLSLEDLEFHHLAHVMRIKENETIELVNGQGQLASATVLQMGKKNAQLKIDSLINEPKPTDRLILAQALPRLNRLDLILEKTTELGVTEIWLFPGKLSEKKEYNPQRAEQILINAMKQSGRLFLPALRYFPSLEKCPIETIPFYFGDLSEGALPLKIAAAGIFIGPEKGFSENEIEWLKKHAQGVKINRNVLRTDTAAIASIALLANLQTKHSL